MGTRVVVVLLSAAIAFGVYIPAFSHAGAMEPDYAKWGRLAVQQTASKYKAEIIDYKYEGYYKDNGGQAEERFLLWIRKENKEFGVRVTIHIKGNSASSVEFKQLN
ncbi:MAG: DUF3889 domain-containing protein [Candidatus Pristimantibacillus sp.]